MNDPIQHKLVEALDRRARDIDGRTLSRLRRARAAAVEQSQHRPVWPLGNWRTAGAGLAVALLLAAALMPALYRAPAPSTFPEEEWLEIATLDADLELVEEMEFYEWLSVQSLEETAKGGAA